MDIHENARTTPRSRMLMIERLEAGWTVAAVASAQGVDGRTVRKWRDRFRLEGVGGLEDRSSRPHSCPSRLDREAEAGIETLRRCRLSGPAIARRLGRPVSTVGKVLRRIGLGRLKALDPAVPVVRYERERPDKLARVDLRDTLRDIFTTNRRHARMAHRLQHTTTSRRPRRKASYLKARGQPP